MKKKLKIAIQGAEASFHHMAAIAHFPDQEVEILECRRFKEVCETLVKDQVDLSLMAIENTLTGSLLPNYSLLQQHPIHIIGETYLHIEQNLMALPGQQISDLKFVHSHPIALQQCTEFLRSHPKMIAIEKYDTAGSAREIVEQKQKGIGAIAGPQAAKTYGLEILAAEIENLKQNYTRFLVLSRDSNGHEVPGNKASVCFEVSHKVGALAEVLQTLGEHKINLTKIQSVPILGKPYQYQFHVDLEWAEGASLQMALEHLEPNTYNRKVLGIYKKGKRHYDHRQSKAAAAS